jgi:GMP synthase-like glutamine amidotransferase
MEIHMNPRILVFQHIEIEHPGIFRDFMKADGVVWDTVELDAGDAIPDLGGYDGLMVMGGPMDIWQEQEHPWLVAEKAAIREAVAERRMPYLGLCLGHQLLADALGGGVRAMETPEVGVLEVVLTEHGRGDPLLGGGPERFQALQWHGAEVWQLPQDSVVLAQSPLSPIQALRVGDRAYGLQYHLEMTADTVSEWAQVPEYAQSLERTLGAGALEQIDGRTRELMPGFNRQAKQLHEGFMRLVRDSIA